MTIPEMDHKPVINVVMTSAKRPKAASGQLQSWSPGQTAHVLRSEGDMIKNKKIKNGSSC